MNKLKNLLQQVNWSKRSILEKIGIVYLSGLLVFLVVGSISRMVTPLNCDQARARLASAQAESRSEWARVESGKISGGAATVAVSDADKAVTQAASKAADLCR